jgi:hypothetical protein
MKLTARNTRNVFALLGVCLFASNASADWHTFWHNVRVDTHRNNAWPDPFNEADAMQVVAPFEKMKNNGWRVHNTIGHELFRGGDGALLASGNKRVEWISSQAPAARRDIFVMRGRTDQETQARVDSVRQTLASLGNTNPPQIWVTDIEPTTASGAWATQLNRMWLQELPAPKLPGTSASGKEGVSK